MRRTEASGEHGGSIFVQIPSYRDPECGPTVRDAFAKAARPERVFVGVCSQLLPDDDDELELSPEMAARVRIDRVDARESQGVGWARSRAQRLYHGETYCLSIDSHMRFTRGWDDALISELAACASDKPLLTGHPAGYTPPNHLQENLRSLVQRVGLFQARGTIRSLGEEVDRRPPAPLRGAFVACGMMFARANVWQEVPFDPYVYFDQEEISLSVRLFTHGWDVYHPTIQHLYHYYTIGAGRNERPLHWEDHPHWSEFQERAVARYRHLLGMESSHDPDVLKDLDAYGLGHVRSLEQFERFSGLDFRHQIATERALRCQFIEGLEQYVDRPNGRLWIAELDELGQEVPATANVRVNVDANPEAVLLAGSDQAPIVPDPAWFRVCRDAPPGVLVLRDYLSPAACRRICAYADGVAGQQLGVVDPIRTTASQVVGMMHHGRVTQYVNIDGLSAEILSLFLDAYCNRLAPFFDIAFEWFERPQILRYPPGGQYDRHSDSDNLDPQTGRWSRQQDRDYSVVLYLNDAFEGGELELPHFDYRLRPEPGMLVAFPSDHRYEHAARPTTSGVRYAIVSWAAVWGSERVQTHPAPGSVMVWQRRGPG